MIRSTCWSGIISALALCASLACGNGGDRAWRYDTYGTAEWHQEPAGTIRISGPVPPSGLFARLTHLNDGIYRLRMRGAVIAGNALLKITQENREPVWLAAPNGEHSVVIDGGGALELLLYSESPFTYELSAISIEPYQSAWRPVVYGTASWDISPSGALNLTVQQPPGGLYFHSPSNIEPLTRIHLRGKPLQGTATVRVQVSGNTSRWLAAPDGNLYINVAGGPVELLIYGDNAFAYEVQTLDFAPCPACLDDFGMKAILKRDIDGLEHALATDPLQAATLLLDWAANTVDLGWMGAADRGVNLAGLTAAQVYQDFWTPDAVGSSCGGFSMFLRELLALFALPAFTIDIGYPESNLTHVTVMLVTGTAPAFRFHVLDPTFNGRYIHQDGSAADLATVLDRFRRNQADYRFATSAIKRDVLYHPEELPGLRDALRAVGYDAVVCKSSNLAGNPTGVCKDVPYALPFLMHTWGPELAQRRVLPEPDLLLRLLTHRVMTATAEGAILESFRQLLEAHRIPFGAS